MEIDTIFFDLDATLYPASNGLWGLIKTNILDYMVDLVGIPGEESRDLRQQYLETYGSTLAGLQRHHQVDAEHYLDYVHNIPLQKYISPDSKLRHILKSLPYRLWVFTNSDIKHATRVLKMLELDDLFEGITDMYAMQFNIKPSPTAYQTALRLAGHPDPGKCLLFDDLPRNLKGAKTFGMTTILVGDELSIPEVDYRVDHLNQIPGSLPFLWTDAGLTPPDINPR